MFFKFIVSVKIQVLVFVLLLITCNTKAQELRLQTGVVTDSIVVPGTEDTYAIYLPKEFTLQKNWPVVFVFDPGAKGKNAISYFIEAAEEYQYVILASNAVKNGPYQTNLRRAARLVNTINDNFPVDKQRIYLAGLSGGARLAIAIASISDNVAGVIASGAGYTDSSMLIPENKLFALIGMAGNKDFNYLEVKNTVEILQRAKYNAEFVPFEGTHTWPPAPQVKKALRLFDLKAITQGKLAENDSLVHSFYKKDYKYNIELRNKSYLVWAYNDLLKIRENYRFHVAADSLKEQIKFLEKNENYKLQKNIEELVLDFEERYRNDYLYFLQEDIEAANMDQIGFWDNEVNNIDNFAKSKGREGENMAERLKSFANILAFEFSTQYNEEEHTNNLLYANIVQVIMKPDNYEPYFKILQYATKKSEYAMALFYLEELLKNDFKDSDRLNNLEGIALLRIMPEYNETLEKYGLERRY